jgi:Ca-activated chloride channel family protein
MKNERALLELSARFDRAKAWRRGNSVRYLVLEAHAANPPRPEGVELPPLNLALVIDNSGSMSGAPLAAAQRAALGVVEVLTEKDRLSLVTFETGVETWFEAMPMDEAGRARAAAEINRIPSRSSTNLSGGYLRGAECVAREMERRGGTRNRVLLLTDGHANAGIVDPVELGRHARELCRRGLVSSAVGIGEGYSTEQIQAIAEQGGGRMHHAARPEEIVEVVRGELLDTQATVVENLELHLDLPDGVRVEPLTEYPVVLGERRVTASLGALGPDARRKMIWRVFAPAGDAGRSLDFLATAAWTEPGSGEAGGTAAMASLVFAGGEENNAQPRDLELSLEVGRLWLAQVVSRAVRRNRAGDYREVLAWFDREFRHFRDYLAGVPGAAVFIEELESLGPRLRYDWGEGARKEVACFSMKAMRCEDEYRASRRDRNWTEDLPEAPPAF